ncbi:MAG: hypothetical protein M1514_00585 [Patescibacteria group bacterium]|nr:hypothetical protein [Patescibacteria group bacterium]
METTVQDEVFSESRSAVLERHRGLFLLNRNPDVKNVSLAEEEGIIHLKIESQDGIGFNFWLKEPDKDEFDSSSYYYSMVVSRQLLEVKGFEAFTQKKKIDVLKRLKADQPEARVMVNDRLLALRTDYQRGGWKNLAEDEAYVLRNVLMQETGSQLAVRRQIEIGIPTSSAGFFIFLHEWGHLNRGSQEVRTEEDERLASDFALLRWHEMAGELGLNVNDEQLLLLANFCLEYIDPRISHGQVRTGWSKLTGEPKNKLDHLLSVGESLMPKPETLLYQPEVLPDNGRIVINYDTVFDYWNQLGAICEGANNLLIKRGQGMDTGNRPVSQEILEDWTMNSLGILVLAYERGKMMAAVAAELDWSVYMIFNLVKDKQATIRTKDLVFEVLKRMPYGFNRVCAEVKEGIKASEARVRGYKMLGFEEGFRLENRYREFISRRHGMIPLSAEVQPTINRLQKAAFFRLS